MTQPTNPGPQLRTDFLDAYVFRVHDSGDVDLLQLLRARDPIARTWQPVMGHIEAGETAVEAFWRELREEIALSPEDPGFVAAWSLDGVHPLFIHRMDAIFLCPRFAVRVTPGWSPTLNDEHTDSRWIPAAAAVDHFMWPGQHESIREITDLLLRPGSLCEQHLRLDGP